MTRWRPHRMADDDDDIELPPDAYEEPSAFDPHDEQQLESNMRWEHAQVASDGRKRFHNANWRKRRARKAQRLARCRQKSNK